MDKFPDDMNLMRCKEIIEAKQLDLLRKTRENFYKKVKEGVDKCSHIIKLVFPENLWHTHRKVILVELLERFGEVTIVTKQNNNIVTRITDNSDDVVQIDEITLEFFEK